MTAATLAFALLALLTTPGPTNALLALSGARAGLWPSLRLIPVEMAAYLAVIAPLLIWGAPLVAHLPLLRPLLAALAAIWVAILALRLWRMPATNAAGGALAGPGFGAVAGAFVGVAGSAGDGRLTGLRPCHKVGRPPSLACAAPLCISKEPTIPIIPIIDLKTYFANGENHRSRRVRHGYGRSAARSD